MDGAHPQHAPEKEQRQKAGDERNAVDDEKAPRRGDACIGGVSREHELEHDAEHDERTDDEPERDIAAAALYKQGERDQHEDGRRHHDRKIQVSRSGQTKEQVQAEGGHEQQLCEHSLQRLLRAKRMQRPAHFGERLRYAADGVHHIGDEQAYRLPARAENVPILFALSGSEYCRPAHDSHSTKPNQFCLEIILCRIRGAFDYLMYPYYPAYMG